MCPHCRQRSGGRRATREAGARVVSGGREQSNTCKGSPRCPRWPGYQATRRESPHVGGGRETRAAGAPVVGGVQDTGQPEQRVLHGLPPPCWSKGVLFVGLLESSPVMNTSAYARSNPTSTTCTPISMVVVGCATPSLSTAAGRLADNRI